MGTMRLIYQFWMKNVENMKWRIILIMYCVPSKINTNFKHCVILSHIANIFISDITMKDYAITIKLVV